MTTKDEFLNRKHQYSENDSNQIENQYSNFNLNQNYKCSPLIHVHSHNKPNTDKYGEKPQTSKTSNFMKFDDKNEEKAKMCQNNDDSSFSNKNSTLSLHISAYENSDKTKSDSNESQKSGLITKKEIFTASKIIIQNPLEFPRQQNNKMSEPEVSNYKASQRLFNPNKALKNNNKQVMDIQMEHDAENYPTNITNNNTTSTKNITEISPPPLNGRQKYGVSQPISMQPPTNAEIELTIKLEAELEAKKVYETEKEHDVRLEVLRRINALVKAWVKHVSVEKGLPPEQVEKSGGKLFTFGSYRLGVYTRGADIDSLCVAPRHVERSDFFSSFFQMLKEDSNVTELHAVEEAFVPLIKLRYNGIELDILFARLALREVGEDQKLDDDSLLRNLDEKSIRSLNGCRVADEILKSIPNQKTFTVALRTVKLWAKNHSIYSNSLGFLGGISWAILVARTCQLYPNATPATIIEKFFLVFGTWDWPHPVFLKDSDTQSKRADIIVLNDLVWDPRKRVQDRYHLMPIITPAYPEQNSTFNVTKSTRQIITNEFRDGLQTMFEIVSGEKTWHQLLEEVNFFSRYRHFICLICATEDEEDHLVFSSLVESKIRHLISFFENNSCVNLCHICPRQFKPLPSCDVGVDYKNPVVTLWFVGLDFIKSLKRDIDLSLEIQQFDDVLKASDTTNSYKSTMIVRPFYVKRSDLQKWISKEDFEYGRQYVRPRLINANICSINIKEIAGEKSLNIMAKLDDLENDDMSNVFIQAKPRQPARKRDDKFVSPSAPLLIPQLLHSASTPNLDGKSTLLCFKHAYVFPSHTILTPKRRSYAVVAASVGTTASTPCGQSSKSCESVQSDSTQSSLLQNRPSSYATAVLSKAE